MHPSFYVASSVSGRLAGGRIRVFHQGPKPHGNTLHSQCECIPSPTFEAQQSLVSAPRGVALPILNDHEPLRQKLQLASLTPKTDGDAVSPDINQGLPVQHSLSLQPPYFFAQSRLRHETVFMESPVASRPRRRFRAAPISPLETPIR